MERVRFRSCSSIFILAFVALLILFDSDHSWGDLQDVRQRNVLRHLGVPYANFVTGSGDGLDVELMKSFALHLGVGYEFVKSSWTDVIGDLTGKIVLPKGDDVEVLGDVPIRADIIASGMTILPWREKMVDFSMPTFPTQVWLIARADSPLKPIRPTGRIDRDIDEVRVLLHGHEILGKPNTCLDPRLYNLQDTGCRVRSFEGALNELAPAIINGEAELTLLDVPDALIALDRWPGEIKIIGPISDVQDMGCAFAKTSPDLRQAFNQFFDQCKKDGAYLKLVKKYYPNVFYHFPDFLKER